jgi:hypothetical protein
MAYADLYSDAAIYFPLNNDYTYSTIGTLNSGLSSTYTGTPTFVADAPTGLGSTHSFKLNGYAAATNVRPPRYVFNNMANQSDDANIKGKTVTFWYKQTTPSSGTSLGSSAVVLYSNNTVNAGHFDTSYINQGTYNARVNTGTDRSFDFRVPETNTTNASQTNPNYRASGDKLDLDLWHHVAIIIREVDDQNIIEKTIFVDGAFIVNQFNSNSGTSGRTQTLPFFTSGSTDFYIFNHIQDTLTTNGNKYIAHYGVWNKPLTIQQIREQAWYGHSNEDYTSLVLSDSPSYLAVFDNTSKSNDHTVYGATSWGTFDDSPSGIQVNQAAFANKKGWLFPSTSTAVNNYTQTTDADMMDGVSAGVQSGEYSIEFWFKQSAKPTANKNIIQTNPNYAASYFEHFINANGQILGYHSIPTAPDPTSSWSRSLSTSQMQYPGSTSGQQFLNLVPVAAGGNGWADNEWHHAAITFSVTDFYWNATTYALTFFVDGGLASTLLIPNTYGWPAIGQSSFLQLGHASTSTTLGNTSLAHLAFYPRRLTKKEINEHFVAGKDYIAGLDVRYYDGSNWIASSGQKVWDGTAWIDWDASYWNGTSWVAL